MRDNGVFLQGIRGFAVSRRCAYSNTDVGGRFNMLGGSVAIFVVEIFDFTF